MNQKISITPGERYYGTFKITNPATGVGRFDYKTSITPFYVDDSFNIKYENNGDYNQIVDWITVENPTGSIMPNQTEVVKFYVDVPENAPAGGQYAVIKVTSDNNAEATDGLNIQQEFSIAHAIFAEVAGETRRGGNFDEMSVKSFMFSGKISGTSTITNTGNVHSDATYTLSVFPLFSKEELYTNEEDPLTARILPEVSRTTTLTWEETPKMGIFHVVYTASFEGIDKTIDKYVIICPIWLLVIILAIIFLILFKILFTGKKDKKEK
ncbi:hypothetical protein IKF81_02305 [Candidatus Saccharibacteria bacterium]|nr:hypothetical protein [Candidatus Saccharibacteria bacterium]